MCGAPVAKPNSAGAWDSGIPGMAAAADSGSAAAALAAAARAASALSGPESSTRMGPGDEETTALGAGMRGSLDSPPCGVPLLVAGGVLLEWLLLPVLLASGTGLLRANGGTQLFKTRTRG